MQKQLKIYNFLPHTFSRRYVKLFIRMILWKRSTFSFCMLCVCTVHNRSPIRFDGGPQKKKKKNWTRTFFGSIRWSDLSLLYRVIYSRLLLAHWDISVTWLAMDFLYILCLLFRMDSNKTKTVSRKQVHIQF